MIDRIGNCRIVDEIGAGGMAVVYRAVQESLGRTVAVKALKPAAASEPNFPTRFEREALSVAALQHENIVQVYDFHREGAAAFIVMEFVDGIDLFALLGRSGALPVDVAAIVALQLARALDHAHYRGIIHRDIKPANVMVAKSGAVKLMDFGIARDESFDDLTRDGTGLGTPSYMSPEQVLGEKLDSRSDLFSLGIVLYQMLCGRKPFVEDERRSVMHKIRVEAPVPPRRLRRGIPRELEAVALRCLEKAPEDRYRSTQDLVVALERFLAPRCRVNYRARLVSFLLERGVVSSEEAERHLRTGGHRQVEAAAPRLRRLVAIEAAVLAAMALAIAGIHLLPSRGDGAATVAGGRAGDRTPSLGYVRVVANAGADVLVDGRKVGTAPLPRPLSLAAGRHRLEARGPRSTGEARDVVVERGDNPPVRLASRP
jgi:serine/threonine-protein kinase